MDFFDFQPLNSVYLQRTIVENIFHYTCNKTKYSKKIIFKEWNLNKSYKMLIALIFFRNVGIWHITPMWFCMHNKKMEPKHQLC